MIQLERLESGLWQTASLLLIADGEAVAIDPCISVEEVAAVDARARAVDASVGHVVVTHADWDHVCGLAAFPDAVVAMGPRSAEIVSSGAAARAVAQRAADYGLSVPGGPRVDRVLEPGLAHRIGPFTVETLALPGHTPDGTAYRVRSLDLLAVGDYLSAIEFPIAASTADYRMTLAGLIDLLRRDPPGLVVPGHGPSLTAGEALAIAEDDLAYLHGVREAVAAAIASEGSDAPRAAGLAVEPPRPAADDLLEMHAANVEAQLAELSAPAED